MGLQPPLWHVLFKNVTRLNSATARQDIGNTMRHIEQNNSRIVFTTYDKPRVAFVPLRDLALLQILDARPELKSEVEKFLLE